MKTTRQIVAASTVLSVILWTCSPILAFQRGGRGGGARAGGGGARPSMGHVGGGGGRPSMGGGARPSMGSRTFTVAAFTVAAFGR